MHNTQMIALGKSFLLWFGLQILAKAKKGARSQNVYKVYVHTTHISAT